MPKIDEGDEVLLRARVERVWDDGTISVHVRGYDMAPITLEPEYVESVLPRPKRKPIYDKPD